MSLEAVVNTLLGRLEQVAARLEKIEKQISVGGGSGAGAAPGGDTSASVAAFDAIVEEHLTGYYAKSEEIGGVVAQQAAEFKKLVAAHRRILETAAASKKPADADLAKIAGPQGEAGQAVQKIAGDNRPSPLFVNLSTVSEAVGAFMWFAMAPTPVPYINETIGSSEYHSNKIRRDQKGKDEKQIEWVGHFNGFLKALSAFVKQNHTTGISWNAKGGNALDFAGSGAAPAASSSGAGGPPPPAGGPPPPGPPPPAASGAGSSSSSSSGDADMSGVFAALSKGEGVTSGLRKVTNDMKSKNRADRSGKVEEKEAPKPTGRLGVRAPAVSNQPPKLELQGNKWVVEYQTGPVSITITEKKQTVYIYKCTGATVQLSGKLNAITIDSCKKTNVVFDEAISSCEVVNCNGIKVQVTVKVPAITIDKTSGGVVYLSKDSLDTQIFTSKSDELNVSIPGPSEEQPQLEFPVPEQFLNIIRDGKLHTEMNTHLGD
jgi:adenylyl cyclase-associated protein